jgi:hypothetical protein
VDVHHVCHVFWVVVALAVAEVRDGHPRHVVEDARRDVRGCGARNARQRRGGRAAGVASARVIMAKRWILPASTVFTGIWMALGALTWSAQERQLRKAPIEVKIFAKLPALKRPLWTVMISGALAVGVVWTRG